MEPRGPADESSDSPERHPDLIKALQKATITENGEERIRPDVMGFLMQAAAASHLGRLRRLEESKIPIGTKPIEISVTKRIKVQFQPPFISFTLINDGPNSVFLDMNTEISSGQIAPIKLNESFTFDAVYPVINYLVLDVAAGGTAAIRIRGKTGRHLALTRG